jgi:hypothetical protein
MRKVRVFAVLLAAFTVSAAQAETVAFHNASMFTVSVRRDSSGGQELCTLKAGERVNASYDSKNNETIFYPVYEVPVGAHTLKGQIDGSIFFVIKKDTGNKKTNTEVTIPNPSRFENNSVYVVFRNEGSSVSLQHGNSFLTLIGSSETTVNAGEIAVYEVTPLTFRNIELYPHGEKVPALDMQPSFVYIFTFDGTSVTLNDARPLHKIGEAVPASLVFRADAIPDAEQKRFAETLQVALQQNGVPVRIAADSDTARQGLSAYTIVITISSAIQPPRPPTNMQLVTGDVEAAFLRDGKTVAQSGKRAITEMDMAGFYRVAARFIRDNKQFFLDMAKEVIR